MSHTNDWSPDEQLGTETFEQGDEALDETSRVNSSFLDELEGDPSLDPALQLDNRELEEAGAELDDPEILVTLDGGIDDPDGLDEPTERSGAERGDENGWELDASLAKQERTDEETPD